MSGEMDYLFVLKALREIPFGVGKKLLTDFLRGNKSNDSVQKNRLYQLENFGSLVYEKDELNELIDNLVFNDMIQAASVNSNKFWKVLELTSKGLNEIDSPSLYKRKLSFNLKKTKTEITEKDRKIFEEFGDLLSKFNDEQKKSIITNGKHVLCLAGAGSGKTTALTKRVEFLVKYRSVEPQKILAITFTRKARQEMMKRLSQMPGVHVETFNSFCEKILRQHNNKVYDRQTRVISYKDKVMMIKKALSRLGTNMENAINTYFSHAQKRGKTEEQLASIFMNDCFFIRDYFKFKNKKIQESSFDAAEAGHKESVKTVLGVCNYIEAYMKKHGLRDFADQMIDAISLFEKHDSLIPKFEHILVDEYQDVNSTQIKLLDILSPENLFCVGDPRQSIFGWRGSDIRHILNFEEKYPESEIITLTKNYRSTKHIVNLINDSIKRMGMADLNSELKGEKDIKLLEFDSESAEFEFVIQGITASELPRNEIFVLARTNRQLNELSQIMKLRKIKHVVRSDELRKTVLAKEDDITLATVHAIKGMEAKMVFVIGCNGIYFPCKGSEHPIIEMVKVEEYDKEEEERRLLYVAMSRAKNTLYISYSGKRHSSFITSSMLDIMEKKEVKLEPKINAGISDNVMTRLKEWRREESKKHNIPAYIIMHDRTMINIAQEKPATLAELQEIYGMGPAKILKYGKEILEAVNN